MTFEAASCTLALLVSGVALLVSFLAGRHAHTTESFSVAAFSPSMRDTTDACFL
jgi:hypothetical protein